MNYLKNYYLKLLLFKLFKKLMQYIKMSLYEKQEYGILDFKNH